VTALVKLAPGALAVGHPLPWTVYDLNGVLLVRRGYVVQSERQLERLYERGRFYAKALVEEEVPVLAEVPKLVRANPFAEYVTLLQDLENAIDAVMTRSEQAGQYLTDLVARLDQLCVSEPDACLALVHNGSREPTAYEQTLFHAIICRIVAARLELDSDRIALLMLAALTANIALIRHLDKLNSSNKGLTSPQREIIHKHPLLSAAAVEQAGLTDPVLLQIIRQHHERVDGGGYPAGLGAADILVEARVLALAERYTAMTSPRGYRKRYRADHAMAEILETTLREPTPRTSHALVKELTTFPPGVTVRLGNGEIALITHRPVAGEAPVAQAIISSSGNPYIGSFFRDCDEHRIEGIVVPDRFPELNLSDLWGYR